MFGLRTKGPIKAPAEVAGVRVRASLRARRMALRVDIKSGDIILTWPRGAYLGMALRFIEENRCWIDRRRAAMPAPRFFTHGQTISISGEECLITHKAGRGLTRLEGGNLIVHGRPEHLSRRVRDFLKETARLLLKDRAAQKLEQIDRKPTAIRVIDPKTRWGSCSHDGTMMFSWRLILTPPEVLDYVVAHEVAHCIHMNHSKKFWALCASLTENAAVSRRWLKAHGTAVMAYQ